MVTLRLGLVTSAVVASVLSLGLVVTAALADDEAADGSLPEPFSRDIDGEGLAALSDNELGELRGAGGGIDLLEFVEDPEGYLDAHGETLTIITPTTQPDGSVADVTTKLTLPGTKLTGAGTGIKGPIRVPIGTKVIENSSRVTTTSSSSSIGF